MDIFALSNGSGKYSRVDILEDYVSCIWTERYDTPGDFEISFYPNNLKLLGLLTVDRVIMQSESTTPMIVETLSTSQDQDGKTTLKATGRSLEATMLETRSTSGRAAQTGRTGYLIASMINNACVPGLAITATDAYPGFSVNNADTTSPSYTLDFQYTDVLSVMQNLLKGTNTGYSFSLNLATDTLVLRIYNGVARAGVIFSREMESLASSNFVKSRLKYRNVAYVRTTKGTTIVYAPKTASNVSGFSRRAMTVDATDIDATKYTADAFTAAATKKGLNALANQPITNVIDGEIPFNTPFVYRQHYNLGDLAYFEGDFGGKQQVRVTEYIWSSDGTSTRGFPSLVDIDSES